MRRPLAVGVTNAETELRARIAAARRLAKPMGRFPVILRHAVPIRVSGRQPGLRLHIAAARGGQHLRFPGVDGHLQIAPLPIALADK